MKKNKGLSLLFLLLVIGALSISPALSESFEYKQGDLDTQPDAGAQEINFSEKTGTYTIDRGGAYVLSGTLHGQLRIEVNEDDKVHLLFNNATISNPEGVGIYGIQADKITLTLMEGTDNFITDGVDYPMDEEGADAAIYTKTDLSINGTGSLTVTGNTAHGIVSKDDLVLVDGRLFITAVSDGLRGKDRVIVRDGAYVIQAGSDGIHAYDENDAGYIHVDGGAFTISANNDGLQAEGHITINQGTFDIRTGYKREQSNTMQVVPKEAAESQSPPASGERRGGWNERPQGESESAKGIKARDNIAIRQGTFTLNTEDDAIHSNTEVAIHDGTFQITTGGDGIHADSLLHIVGGTIYITESYEGIEAKVVTIDGGTLNITATDDAINAADGAIDTSGRGGRGTQEGVLVTVNGGTITATGGTDGIDSNGNIVINGGDTHLTSRRPSGGNRALDASGSITINGGTVTTNDGSENRGARGW